MMDRFEDDPVERRVDNTYVESSTDSGVTWFIVGALVIAAGVLAYLYFGDDAATTADTGTAIEAPADTGRASTPTAPADSATPGAAPATPDSGTAPADPAAPAPSAP